MQVSGYPSDTQAANVSKDTTTRELLSVEGIDKDTFKNNNIDLLFGVTNNVTYCEEMMNFPSLVDLPCLIKEKNNKVQQVA